MTQEVQCQSWRQEDGPRPDSEHKTMTARYISAPSSRKYLVESFTLNSVDRVVRRGGQGRRPDPRYSKKNRDALALVQDIARESGGKVNTLDLNAMNLYFSKYTAAVNIILQRVYADPKRVDALGKRLSEYRGKGNALLRAELGLSYRSNPEIRELVYERLHRNVLEQCARIILSNWKRRQIIVTVVRLLASSQEDQIRLLKYKRISAELICRVREGCETVKKTDAGYHHALGVLRQLRTALDQAVLAGLGQQMGSRFSQRLRIKAALKKASAQHETAERLVAEKIKEWHERGFPFVAPSARNQSLDFTASTENTQGQGYWFVPDREREDEVLLYIKLPPGIDGTAREGSPFGSKTLVFRFLDWLPKAASEDRTKAQRERTDGKPHRVKRFEFRAAMFTDMHQQLMNTIEFQKKAYQLMRLKGTMNHDPKDIAALEVEVQGLRASRRSAPPNLLVRGKRVTIRMPFHTPDKAVIHQALGEPKYERKAGVDRGVRVPVALSVKKEEQYVDLLPSVDGLIKRRAAMRRTASILTSEVELRRNNWERKRPGLPYPGHLLKRIRHMDAVWAKVKRIDREISLQVASETTWFCEENGVRTVFFEDLKDFEAASGLGSLSWSLSMNLWGRIIDSVRYMRETLGHSRYSVWTVNPRYTSQICHECGEKGIRVEDRELMIESKGGQYLYCSHCNTHCHADINAARNIIHVQSKSSVASGRKTGGLPN